MHAWNDCVMLTEWSSQNDHEDDDLASPGGLGGGQGWQPSMGYETDGSSYYGTSCLLLIRAV